MISLSLSAIRNAQGSIVGFASVARNITERKRIEDARLQTLIELERRSKEQEVLIKAATCVLEQRDFVSTARNMFDAAREITGAQSGYVALLSANGAENELLFLESGGLPCTVDPTLPMPVRGLHAEVYKSGRAVQDNNFMSGPWADLMPPGHMELKNIMFAPLNIEGKTVGVMGLANKPSSFTDEDLRIASAIGQLAAIALANSRSLEALKQSEEHFRSVVTNAPLGIFQSTPEGQLISVNPMYATISGYDSPQEMIAAVNRKDVATVLYDDSAKRRLIVEKAVRSGKWERFENQYRRKSGELIIANLILRAYKRRENMSYELEGFVEDITKSKQAEAALRDSEELMRLFFERQLVGMAISDTEKRWVQVNDRLCQMLGYTRDELLRLDWLRITDPDDAKADVFQFNRMCEGDIDDYSMEKRYIRKDGSIVHINLSVACIRRADRSVNYVLALMEDITERKRVEEEKEKLHAQLLQAQKMESVGRLAGGVAHDFNNMLGVILGHSEMALEGVDPSQPLHDDLEEIHKAAERSAVLTRQLLAFARKQTVAPKVIDLNQTLARMLTMLERLIGEDVQLVWKPWADLWPVKIDSSQLDQILTNLCVNARDAIADVGTITIETENTGIDEGDYPDLQGSAPGEYVRLTVRDDGCGMDEETLLHLFEPFFTTKEVGKGTGLGLAMVYGAVKQNRGFIKVQSETGQGANFSIYLPRHMGEVEQTRNQAPTVPSSRGQETILVVEDEPASLKLIKRMLERQGYTVLEAGTPGEAIGVAREHAAEIHLLMTDVIMPKMNGRSLARILMSLYPQLKCLFMSGYTDDVIADHGVLEEGVSFIQKPFSAKDLADKVRQTLEKRSTLSR
jgi:PAS domain S-box-containing protein